MRRRKGIICDFFLFLVALLLVSCDNYRLYYPERTVYIYNPTDKAVEITSVGLESNVFELELKAFEGQYFTVNKYSKEISIHANGPYYKFVKQSVPIGTYESEKTINLEPNCSFIIIYNLTHSLMNLVSYDGEYAMYDAEWKTSDCYDNAAIPHGSERAIRSENEIGSFKIDFFIGKDSYSSVEEIKSPSYGHTELVILTKKDIECTGPFQKSAS